MTVVRLEEMGKGRLRVWLLGQPPFLLYRKEAAALQLREGGCLPEAQYQELLAEALIPRARKRAMHLLERMDRTEAQLREKLAQSQYPERAVEEAIAYVKRFGYVDDLRYARSYVRSRCDSRSRRLLSSELLGKGVAREDVERALDEEYAEGEESGKILRWMEKKRYDPGQAGQGDMRRMYQFLLRKGFRSEDIMRHLT